MQRSVHVHKEIFEIDIAEKGSTDQAIDINMPRSNLERNLKIALQLYVLLKATIMPLLKRDMVYTVYMCKQKNQAYQ